MSIKKTLASLCLLLFGISAQAGVMTSTAVGTINQSYLGFASEFGPESYGAGSLNGQAFNLVIGFDVAGSGYSSMPFSGQVVGHGPVTVSMTVNNMTHSVTLLGGASAELENELSGGVTNGVDEMRAGTFLVDYVDGTRVETSMLLYSLINGFVGASHDPRTNMTRTLSGQDDVMRISYDWYNTDGNVVDFSGTISSLSFEYTADAVDPAAVPEPGTMAVFGIGLVAFGATRRKSGKHRA